MKCNNLVPYLFLLHIYDLPSFIKHRTVFLNADDARIIVSGRTQEAGMVRVDDPIESFAEWYIRNNILVKIDNTVCLKLTPK